MKIKLISAVFILMTCVEGNIQYNKKEAIHDIITEVIEKFGNPLETIGAIDQVSALFTEKEIDSILSEKQVIGILPKLHGKPLKEKYYDKIDEPEFKELYVNNRT